MSSTVYYSDEHVTLWHGDCREVTGWTLADVLVTDPPYGVAYASNRHRDKRSESNRKARVRVNGDHDSTVRDDALRIWGDKPALVFGRWNVPRPAATRTRLIWDKRFHGMGDLTLPWGPTDEEIYVLGSGFVGPRTGSVLSVPMLMSGDRDRPSHPTPKPIPLMERLIEKTQGIVADPFAGSGATLIAARNLRRHAMGVEIDERYCEQIAVRLSQGVLDFSALA